jgi:hypothetical protein
MGASAREIERQIKETRERMDQNLEVLENRAASGAVRVGKIAAIVAGTASIAGVCLVVWRRTRRPTLRGRLERMSPASLRAAADEVATRLTKPLPSVRITVNDRSREAGIVQSILRQTAPAVVSAAFSALVERIARPSQVRRDPGAAPR